MNDPNLDNKVALITGSSRGIGLATAKELARQGAKIVLNARGRERLDRALEEMLHDGYTAISIQADVTSPDACQNIVDQTIKKFGRLDILINNAGISMRSNLKDLDPETCRKIVDINLMGCIYPTLFSIPQLKKNRGSLVFISSIGGLIGLPTASLYCATKTALKGLADSLRCELVPEGVHVGIVYVGFTENDPEKKVIGPGNSQISPDRPAYISQDEVAKKITALIRKRKRQTVLTPIGKLVGFATWISPGLVESLIIFSRKYKLGERVGIR